MISSSQIEFFILKIYRKNWKEKLENYIAT